MKPAIAFDRKDLDFSYEKVPVALKDSKQWVVWKLQKRSGKYTKVPFQALTGRCADTTDANTWTAFAQALQSQSAGDYNGIGFVFSKGICGIDLDDCRSVGTGEIEDWATQIVKLLDSYTEVSPSGMGLHIFVKAKLSGPGINRSINNHKFEIYDSARFFTVTGLHLEGTPTYIAERQSKVDALYKEVLEQTTKQPSSKPSQSPRLQADDEILRIATRAKNRVKFQKLYAGDASGYKSQSEAELALISILCFYSQDDDQVERLLKASGFIRSKHDRTDYIERTIKKARGSQTKQYRTGSPCKSDELIISESPEQNAYLKTLLRNTARVLDACGLIMDALGFESDHLRILTALIRFGRDELRPFKATQKQLLQKYGKIRSVKTIARDLHELLDEQKNLRVEILKYWPGKQNLRTGEGIPSLFQNLLLQYALRAINQAFESRHQFPNLAKALKVSCQEIATHIPRSLAVEKPVTVISEAKLMKQKTQRAVNEFARVLAELKEYGANDEEIENFADSIKTDALNRVMKSPEQSDNPVPPIIPVKIKKAGQH